MDAWVTMASGGFGRFLDDETVQYERVFAHPIKRVWRAITDPVEVKGWLFAISIELRPGGAWTTSGEGDWSGEVTAADPPRLLRCQHAAHMPGGVEGYFQYELAPVAGGTRMVFTEHFPGIGGGLARDPDGVAGGWHEIFDSLTEWLDGGPVGARLPKTDLGEIAKAWAGSMVRGGEFDQAAGDRYVLDLRREEASTALNHEYRARAEAGLARRGDAGLARFPDRWTVEYLRTYPHPIERVWRAITEPKEFGAWFIRGDIELKAGGAYHFKAEDWTGVVQAVDPPRYIRFGNKIGEAEGWFEYELTPVAGGTRMRFAQRFDPNGVYDATPGDLGGDLPAGPGTPWKPGFVGGWHEFWDSLGDYLDGVLTGSRLPKTEMALLADSFMEGLVREGRMTEDNARRLTLGLRRHERWNELNKLYRVYIPHAVPGDPR